MSGCRQAACTGKIKTREGKAVAEQSKKARTTTIQITTTEQASEPHSDAFTCDCSAGGHSRRRLVQDLGGRHGTAAEQLQHILRQLEKMTCQCRITRLNLSSCSISGQTAERLPGLLAQCSGLFELDLSGREIGDEGAGEIMPDITNL
jgi:hypothetical protein